MQNGILPSQQKKPHENSLKSEKRNTVAWSEGVPHSLNLVYQLDDEKLATYHLSIKKMRQIKREHNHPT